MDKVAIFVNADWTFPACLVFSQSLLILGRVGNVIRGQVESTIKSRCIQNVYTLRKGYTKLTCHDLNRKILGLEVFLRRNDNVIHGYKQTHY